MSPNTMIIRRKWKLEQNEHNDAFANALDLQAFGNIDSTPVPWLVSGNTVESGEPVCAALADALANDAGDGQPHQTVWFKIKAGIGDVTMHTGVDGDPTDPAFRPFSYTSEFYSEWGGSSFPPYWNFLNLFIGVYTGDPAAGIGGLSEVASSWPTTADTPVTFTAVEGVTYYVQVGCPLEGETGVAFFYYDVPVPAS